MASRILMKFNIQIKEGLGQMCINFQIDSPKDKAKTRLRKSVNQTLDHRVYLYFGEPFKIQKQRLRKAKSGTTLYAYIVHHPLLESTMMEEHGNVETGQKYKTIFYEERKNNRYKTLMNYLKKSTEMNAQSLF